MLIDIETSSEDYWKYSQFVQSQKSQSALLTSTCFMSAFSIGYPLGYMVYVINNSLNGDLVHWIAGPVISLILFILSSILSRQLMRKVYEPIPGGYTLGKKTYEFSAEGIKVSAAEYSCIYEWGQILEIEENEDHVYLFLDTVIAYIIPKRILGSDADVADFKQRINQWRAATQSNNV